MRIKVVIIGGGAVGMGVASKLLREKAKNNKGYDIHVYQEKDYISLGACGMPYFIANDFRNPKMLNERTKKDYNLKKDSISKIKIHLKEKVLKVNPGKQEIHFTKLDKPKNITKTNYHILVIATGATPKIPAPFSHGVLPHNVFNIVTKQDAIKFKKRLKEANKITIIGGGFIGLEIAEACLKQKKEVTIIEAQDQLMGYTLDKEFSQLIYNEITGKESKENKKKQNFAKVFLNYKIDELMLTNNEVKDLRIRNMKNEKQGTTIPCDLVVLATGFLPHTEFLKDSNIKLTENKAIVINEKCQVGYLNSDSQKLSNVFSAGDCAQVYNHLTQQPHYLPLATTANKMARIIAANINNPIHDFPGTLGSSIVRIGKLEIAKTGIMQDTNKSIIKSVFIEDYDLPKYFKHAQPLYLKLFYNSQTFQLLGAQMAGYNHATLRINALAVAIWNKMDIRELQNLDLVYSPPFSRVNDIIHLASRKIK